MSEGVFCVHRGVFKHDFFADEPYTEREAWLWLLGNAVWKPSRVRVKDTMFNLQRGQCAYSLRFLGTQWGWSKNKASRFLERLENESMIGTQAGRDATLITICKYDEYQFDPSPRRDAERDAGGTQAGRRRDKEEELNKENKEDTGASRRAAAYVFESGVIRLNSKDFEKWREAYTHLDLRAELLSLSEWAEGQGAKWFHAVQGALAKRNREQRLRQQQGPPGGKQPDFYDPRIRYR